MKSIANTGRYVMMGVAGSGKSTVGSAFARAIGADFVEGDEYHPAANVAKMAAGTPLTDDDRAGWLRSLAGRIRKAERAGKGLVLTCSALKRSYRDVLRDGASELQFVFLTGPRALLAQRLASRQGHFMPPSLLESQLATLEEPAPDEKAWVFHIESSPDKLVDQLTARALK